jgi:hypothetical protein
MNTGNMRVLDEMVNFAYNGSLPQPENKHLTRVRFSDIHDQYSVVDGYRNIMPLAYKDFDSSKQQMMKVGVLDGELITVQEDCINKHFTKEKPLTADITSGEIALGSGETLSQEVRKVANYGTQHQASVVFTPKAVYGVDAFRRLIWNAKMTTTTSGSYVMGGDELNRAKFVEKWVYDWFDDTQPITDIIGRLPDTPLKGLGISAGYDAKYKDVIFSFFNYTKSDTTKPLAYTIMGITAFSKKWDAVFTYDVNYQIVYNFADKNWYYSINPTANIGKQPDLYPTYWRLIDFAGMDLFTSGMTVTAGQVIRCCTANSAYDCLDGNIYLVTAGATNVTDCTTLAKTVSGHTNYNVLPMKCCTDKSKTLIYNEDIDEFIGETKYNSVIYANIYNDFFSGGNPELLKSSYLWKHDMSDYLWFYGGEEEMQISFYENGNTDTAIQSELTKSYESQDIHSSDEELYAVDYETEYQSGSHFPFINEEEFWKTPEYLEGHWKVPIIVKDDADSGAYEIDSSMTGTYLKTTFTYRGKVEMFIKNITTYFRKSFS